MDIGSLKLYYYFNIYNKIFNIKSNFPNKFAKHVPKRLNAYLCAIFTKYFNDIVCNIF